MDIQNIDTDSSTVKTNRASARILIVEDDKTCQVILKEVLVMAGYGTVDVCETGSDAIEKIIKTKRSEQYKAAILDIGLPNLNGDEVCEIIRSYEKITCDHLIMIAYSTNIAFFNLKEAGFDACVDKPELSRLIEVLDEQLGRKSDNVNSNTEVWPKSDDRG